MGCTPSVHVSQNTGIVICSRDGSVESESSGLQPVCIVKRLSDYSVTISAELLGQDKTVQRRSSCVTITQTATGLVVSHALPEETKVLGDSSEEALIDLDTIEMEPIQLAEDTSANCELHFGPLKVQKYPMEIQLVFGKEDSQSEAFVSAVKKGGYRYKLHTTPESAIEHFIKRCPELVIIDLRSTTHFDGEELCRNLRSIKPDINAVVMGVVKKTKKDDTSVTPLLNVGFNRRFVENHNATTCLNELLMIDKGEVSQQCKLRATTCLFSAVEHAYDAIEIQCVDPENIEFQYVNPAYEKITGYWRTEVSSGASNNFLSNCDLPKPDSHETISKTLNKGKTWEGICIAHKKGGEKFVQNLKIAPVIGHAGHVSHYIIVKRDLTALEQDRTIQQMHQELRKVQADGRLEDRIAQMSIERRNSSQGALTVPSSLALPEPPITKVINMLNAVQENSPTNVVQILDKVIDILRSSELYTPSSLEEVEGKGVESDLVEGLMWNKRRRSAAEVNPKGGSMVHRDSSAQVIPLISPDKGIHFEAPPEIQEALLRCDKWDYDIINLEKVTNNRPLFYLGRVLFTQFKVDEYLNVSESVIQNWLMLIEAKYHVHNSYHNSTHAADVLQATSVFLQKADVKAVLDHTDEVASLIAAVVHDVDHPGFTNSFLCNAGHDLAVLYNDIAVLESHHAAMAFQLTAKDSKSNIFQNLNVDQFKLIRQSVIDMVMATEMKQHFEHLAKFDNFNKRHSIHEDNVSTNGRGTPESTTSTVNNFQSPENKGVLRRMIIKCSDIANPARPNKLCQIWAYRIAEEYFKQTEEEQKRDLPIVMPVFDRKTCNVPKSQIFFMDYFVMNLYAAWNNLVQVTEAMNFLHSNYDYWKREAEILEKKEKSR